MRGGAAPADPTARGGIGASAYPAKEGQSGRRGSASRARKGGRKRTPADFAERPDAEKGSAGEAKTRGGPGRQARIVIGPNGGKRRRHKRGRRRGDRGPTTRDRPGQKFVGGREKSSRRRALIGPRREKGMTTRERQGGKGLGGREKSSRRRAVIGRSANWLGMETRERPFGRDEGERRDKPKA